MIKNFIKIFVMLFLSMISFNLFSQQKIVLKNYKGKFPVKTGWRGVRGVYELTKPITIVLDDKEILLPKKTIISDVDKLGKVILPENYTCSVKIGKYNIIVPKGGVIKFNRNNISELQVDNEFLEINNQQVAFRNDWSDGVVFENNTIKSGYLKNDIKWNHYGTILNLHNYEGDTYLLYNTIGNISFYPDETLMQAFINTSCILKTPDDKPIKVNPGFISFYQNGKVKSCFLGEDKTFNINNYSFIIPKGNQIYLEEAGRLASNKTLTINNLKSKDFTIEAPSGKIHLDNEGRIILEEIKIDKSFPLKVTAKTEKFNYTNDIIFMGNGDRSLTFHTNQTPWYGYLAEDQNVIIGDNNFKLKKASFIRFHDNGIIENACLASEMIVTYDNKKYKLLPDADLEFYKDGQINSNMFDYQNKAKGLFIVLN